MYKGMHTIAQSGGVPHALLLYTSGVLAISSNIMTRELLCHCCCKIVVHRVMTQVWILCTYQSYAPLSTLGQWVGI